MKKSLLALAVLGAFAGVASAQSSVTLYGTVDLSAKFVKNDGSARRYSLSQDGINSSQLGFKGSALGSSSHSRADWASVSHLSIWSSDSSVAGGSRYNSLRRGCHTLVGKWMSRWKLLAKVGCIGQHLQSPE